MVEIGVLVVEKKEGQGHLDFASFSPTTFTTLRPPTSTLLPSNLLKMSLNYSKWDALEVSLLRGEIVRGGR